MPSHQVHAAPICRRLRWALSPEAALSRWPAEVPLALLWSGGKPSPESRWIALARPMATLSPASVEDLERLTALSRCSTRIPAGAPPFVGGWIGMCGYTIGRQLEPTARFRRGPRIETDWPDLLWQWCPAAYCYDRLAKQWWCVGREPFIGLLPRLAKMKSADVGVFSLGAMRSGMGPTEYQRRVDRVLEYIRAGDVYQVNLAHRLRGPFTGSPRALLARVIDAADPRFGAFMQWPDRCLISASPEMFLRVQPGKAGATITTRPMKGTRPGTGSAAELRRSEKDRAELNMIVDLMRNDLGRVARVGSVRVDVPRAIERHGGTNGVWQATATISARLRKDAGLAAILRATLPGGSVTGAPKIRAMQIIEELEPVSRGPYCGAIGFVSDSEHIGLNIAIRTALIAGRERPGGSFTRGSTLDWYVGAGLVADSDPAAEWKETLDKAGVVLRLTSRGHRTRKRRSATRRVASH